MLVLFGQFGSKTVRSGQTSAPAALPAIKEGSLIVENFLLSGRIVRLQDAEGQVIHSRCSGQPSAKPQGLRALGEGGH